MKARKQRHLKAQTWMDGFMQPGWSGSQEKWEARQTGFVCRCTFSLMYASSAGLPSKHEVIATSGVLKVLNGACDLSMYANSAGLPSKHQKAAHYHAEHWRCTPAQQQYAVAWGA
eukprot:969315-Pelagomonas_calceolata.AAC.1